MTTEESPFERWFRECESLHSVREGLVKYDADLIVHRYKNLIDKRGSRDAQCLMVVEVKTHGAKPDAAQQDTLSIFSQVIRNRHGNRYAEKQGRHLNDHCPPAKAWSHKSNKNIKIHLFGAHLLQLENTDPVNSSWMRWDYKEIDIPMLQGLLLFELDPDTLRKLDLRRRYSAFDEQTLFEITEDRTCSS